MTQEHVTTSKSFIFASLIISIFALSAFVPATWLGMKAPEKKNVPLDFTVLTQNDVKGYDKNNDGKVTWKEVVANSKYGNEIIQEAESAPPSQETIDELNDPNNLTSSFSKNLLLASNQIMSAGGVSGDQQQQIIEQLTQEETKKVVSKKYTYSEIKVAKTEDKTSIKAYGNSVAKIIDKIITKDTLKNDALILQSLQKEGESREILRLAISAERVDSVLKKILALSVPPSAAVYHLIMVNQFTLYRDNLFNLSKAGADPIRGKIAFTSYPKNIVDTLLIYKKLTDYFNLKNITFTQDEPGYVFTIGYTLQ